MSDRCRPAPGLRATGGYRVQSASSLPIIENKRSRQLASSATSGMSEHLADQADENLRFQLADGGEVVVQLPGGHLASRAICRGHGGKAAAQLKAHSGLQIPVAHHVVNSA